MNDFFQDLDMISSRRREVQEGRYKFILEATDPYGFWIVFEVVGDNENKIEGSYTTQRDAKEAIKKYVEKKTAEKVAEKQALTKKEKK